MNEYKLFEADYKLLDLLWENEPINSTEFSKMCVQKIGWKKSTAFNLIKNLCDRKLIQNVNFTLTSLVKREQIQKYESETIIDKKFKGSLPVFLTTFLDNKKITPEEAEKLKRIIEEATN